MARRVPVILAITDVLSGVDVWAWQLRQAMRDHPDLSVETLRWSRSHRWNDRADADVISAREPQPGILPAVLRVSLCRTISGS